MSRRRNSVQENQRRAWGFYGYGGSDGRAVGEVRYVVGWLADQMTRLDWDVLIGGSEKWSVTLPAADGDTPETISTTQADGSEDVTKASGELLELIDWTDTNIRSVTTNLFVAGQGDYVQDAQVDGVGSVASDPWRVVSVVEKQRKKILDRATARVPFLWPHPADASMPDAPLFSVLELLDELDWYNQQARTQSRQRVLITGVLGIADGFEGPPKADGTPSDFWEQWNEMVSGHMDNPDDMSPIRLTGPMTRDVNLIKDGLNWLIPQFGYDDVLDRRVLAAINRLAYGLPVPPEILLGMQAQSRATAFQVEENAYRAHIEPPAWLVAQVPQDALTDILDSVNVEVKPNPTSLLARRNSVQDVKDAYDRGLVKPDYLREVLGIPEDAAPEQDGTPPAGSPNAAPEDPANVAADAPVTAALSDDLSDLLADVDATLSSELAGATFMATDRARQRLGAAARGASTLVRSNPDLKPLTSAQLAVKLGFDGLVLAGVSIEDQIGEPIDTAARWWTTRVHQAWSQVGELVPGWAGQDEWVSTSVKELVEALATHVVDTLTVDDVVPLGADQIRTVVDAAAGGS